MPLGIFALLSLKVKIGMRRTAAILNLDRLIVAHHWGCATQMGRHGGGATDGMWPESQSSTRSEELMSTFVGDVAGASRLAPGGLDLTPDGPQAATCRGVRCRDLGLVVTI